MSVPPESKAWSRPSVSGLFRRRVEWLAILLCVPGLAAQAVQLRFEGIPGAGAELRLSGADSREQLQVTAIRKEGGEADWTRKVRFELSPAGVAKIDANGVLTPMGDGEAALAAIGPDGEKAELKLTVAGYAKPAPVNFPNQIVPIFTKTGCNGGGCHGKASGQNGFRLSLLGFEPAEDYEYLVREARGRRIFPAAPDRSLLLLKATALLPHGGGKRFEVDSADYRLIERWIAQGMPYGSANDPSVARIEVIPNERVMALGSDQQLKVVAHYSNGVREDVTAGALFEPNDKDLAKVDEAGLVTVFQRPGDVAVMVRYQSQVAVFRAALPMGAPITSMPPANNFVDELVFGKLKKMGLPPSDLSDDATFLRRVTLDVAGRLPTPAETGRFVSDSDPEKRTKWVDRLLESPDYAEFFANKWSSLLRNKRVNETHVRGTYAFSTWIRDSLLENKPYDQFVKEILAASGDIEHNPPVAWYRQVRNTTAQLEDTAQLFLGQRLQCAQCHHHPYEKWSQQDYYSLAAFFSQVGRRPGSQMGEEIIFHRRGSPSATNVKTKQPVKPAGLGAIPAEISPDHDPRLALTDWLTQPENPFFARSLVNRYWKHFFGRGLVDPEDDMRETNPPTNPELLAALAESFVKSGYDLKMLVRTISQSRTYQLSAIPTAENNLDRQNFARYYPKRLPAEVLLDAINQVTETETTFEGLPKGTRAVQLPDNSYNASTYFLTVFGRPEMSSSCECERSSDASLAQSLHLLNSKDIQAKLTADQGRAARLARDGTRTEAEKLQELYLAVLSRPPTTEELGQAQQYLDRKPPSADKAQETKRQAYEDILWALVSTKEFLFNH